MQEDSWGDDQGKEFWILCISKPQSKPWTMHAENRLHASNQERFGEILWNLNHTSLTLTSPGEAHTYTEQIQINVTKAQKNKRRFETPIWVSIQKKKKSQCLVYNLKALDIKLTRKTQLLESLKQQISSLYE